MTKSNLNSNLDKILLNFVKKTLLIRNRLIEFLLSIFFGIIIGNLFGTFLPSLRLFIPWDGFIFASIIFVGEFITCITYTARVKHSGILLLNWIKIGIYLGLFMDALKGGS